jgi:hypothetical protein
MPRNQYTFQPGHKFHPPRNPAGPRRLSRKQQHAVMYAALCELNLNTARAIKAGEPVNQMDVTRSFHLQMLMERKLKGLHR